MAKEVLLCHVNSIPLIFSFGLIGILSIMSVSQFTKCFKFEIVSAVK